MKAYALRNRQTGKYVPYRAHYASGSVTLAADSDQPRLFYDVKDANVALTRWLQYRAGKKIEPPDMEIAVFDLTEKYVIRPSTKLERGKNRQKGSIDMRKRVGFLLREHGRLTSDQLAPMVPCHVGTAATIMRALESMGEAKLLYRDENRRLVYAHNAENAQEGRHD